MPFFANQHFPNQKDRPLLFIDLEMSGLDSKKHEILEIAALLVSQPGFEVVNSFYTKVQPQHLETADPASLDVIHYQAKDWKEAIPLRQALKELSDFAPNCILAGWSVQNEWDFLIQALENEDLPYFFDNYLIEVWTLAYARFYKSSELDRISLAKVCRHLGIRLDQHKPDSDIRATFEVFKKLISSRS